MNTQLGEYTASLHSTASNKVTFRFGCCMTDCFQTPPPCDPGADPGPGFCKRGRTKVVKSSL